MLWLNRAKGNMHMSKQLRAFACAPQEVMQLEIVRKGLTLYQEHIRSRQWQRQQSFERTVLSYGSPSPAVSSPVQPFAFRAGL